MSAQLASPRESVSLYAAGGRIYAQNRHAVLIDIGSYQQQQDGFAYRLDAGPAVGGSGLAGADDLLRDLSRHIDRGFLDDQFAHLPDRAQDYQVSLLGAAHRAVALEPATDMAATSTRALRDR